MARDRKPDAIAFKITRVSGRHVGEQDADQRDIQDLLRTIGPVTGLVMTAVGSVYAGLKGILGW